MEKMMRKKYIFIIVSILLILTGCPGSPPPVEEIPVIQAVHVFANLREALEESGRIISEELEANVNIAIIAINALEPMEGEYAMEELTFLLVRSRRFRVVDRHNLDVIRSEQEFQLSGEVDDETAVAIGYLIGAGYVITGSINHWQSVNHLRIRVLDVQTGQIRLMSSTAYGDNL